MGGRDTDWARVAEMRKERKSRLALMKREARVLADEYEAGRRYIRNCDMVLVLQALRDYDPK